MPLKPMHVCNKAGCKRLTRDRYCSVCAKEIQSNYDRDRGTRKERGYGATHQRWRIMVLNRDPLCVECLKQGIYRASTDADHIDGNPFNRSLENGQGLCHACHSRKTAKENNRWGGEVNEKDLC